MRGEEGRGERDDRRNYQREIGDVKNESGSTETERGEGKRAKTRKRYGPGDGPSGNATTV